MEPGTVVPIHRHPEASETMLLLRCMMKVSYYDDNKELTEVHTLEAGRELFGIQVSYGVWNTVEVLTKGTVMLEVKEDPYKPLTDKDVLTNYCYIEGT